jgi:WD40 repeat protein
MEEMLKKIEKAHSESIWSVCWGENILSGSLDENVNIFSTKDYRLKKSLGGFDLGVISITSNSDSSLFAVSSMDCHTRVYSSNTNELLKHYEYGPSESWTSALSPDGQLLAIGTASSRIRLINLKTNETEILSDKSEKFTMCIGFVCCVKKVFLNIIRILVQNILLLDMLMELVLYMMFQNYQ